VAVFKTNRGRPIAESNKKGFESLTGSQTLALLIGAEGRT
jgi:hypothetical protein